MPPSSRQRCSPAHSLRHDAHADALPPFCARAGGYHISCVHAVRPGPLQSRAMAYLLIVDDHVDGRDALCRALEKAGHEVNCCGNGQEALAAVLARRPELIVLDIFMPEMDGPSLLEILRSYLRLASLPVIILTGVPDSPLVDRVRHLKVNAIFVKGKATHEEIAHAVTDELHRVPG